MTPAEKEGLKVGDKIVAIEGYPDYFKKGEIIELKKDDGSNSPLFLKEDRSESWYFDIVEKAWEKYNMNKEFKAMKFWIGDDPELSKQVQEILFGLGYKWKHVEEGPQYLNSTSLATRGGGRVTQASWSRETHEKWASGEQEEINIDWMRAAPNRSIVKIGDKSYYEDELAEALSGINEVKP